MGKRKHKKLDKLFKDNFINEKSVIAHKDIVAKIDEEKEILKNEIKERRNSNNKEFRELARGLVFQFGKFEIQT
ncbi:hypothetical protein EZY14_012895 [Kordia sp. TARA_039_SRF]|nr:hypothetical protein EZY14_012895 [Kordia sp. TARA_039_SRF]